MIANNKILVFLTTLMLIMQSCKNDSKTEEVESYTEGKATILVDESLLPIIEEQEMVFESEYKKAKITLQATPESEIIYQLQKGTVEMAVIAKELNQNDLNGISNTNKYVNVTPICYDAIALIINKSEPVNALTEKEVIDLIKNEKEGTQLVFDNENSSTLNYFLEKAQVKNIPKNITALKNNQEVIKFVAENQKTIGFVGVNWLLYKDEFTVKHFKNVKVLAVGKTKEIAVKPTQSNLKTQTYPFIRKINLLNLQGRNGLGMGFANFIQKDVGQRIVLKSGLLPINIPAREVHVISNKKENK